MIYEHFGELLQELRKKYSMSREQLAENICTTKQIYRIEKGLSQPSIYLLHQLSIKFNIDLNQYYKDYFAKNTLIGIEGINALTSAIEQENLPSIKSLIEKYEVIKDFNTGSNLQYLYYGKAVLSALSDKDYNLSLQYCLKGILLECPNFNLDTFSNNTYSNTALALIHYICRNYFALNQYNTGVKIHLELLDVLENHYISSPYPVLKPSQFSKSLYVDTLYNLSNQLFNNGEINKAIQYVDKGISYSIKEYSIKLLPDLYKIKLKILYHEKNYIEAKLYYNHMIHLYKLTKKLENLKDLDHLVAIQFSEILRV